MGKNNNSKKFQPSLEQVRKIINPHLNGEIQRMQESYDYYVSAKDRALQSLAYENVLLHARNIIEFFFNGTPSSNHWDNVRLRDFVPEHSQATKVIQGYLQLVKDEDYDRLNKQLSHIAYDRLDERKQKQFDVMRIIDALSKAITEYNKNVERTFILTPLYLNRGSTVY